MKHSTKLSGNFYFKVIEKVEFLVSPSRPTTLGFDYLALRRPFPYALRVDIICPIL